MTRRMSCSTRNTVTPCSADAPDQPGHRAPSPTRSCPTPARRGGAAAAPPRGPPPARAGAARRRRGCSRARRAGRPSPRSRSPGRPRRRAAPPPRARGRGPGARRPAPTRPRRWRPVSTFSRTVSPANTLVFWNVRTSPRAAMRCGRQPVIVSPSCRTVPWVGPLEAGDHVERGGLPRPVRPDQARDGAGRYLKAHAGERGHPAEAHREVAGLEDHDAEARRRTPDPSWRRAGTIPCGTKKSTATSRMP